MSVRTPLALKPELSALPPSRRGYLPQLRTSLAEHPNLRALYEAKERFAGFYRIRSHRQAAPDPLLPRRVSALAPAYRPRRPTETVLYELVRDHLETFLEHARVEGAPAHHAGIIVGRSHPRPR